MTMHISARVSWHNDGWNDCICKEPKKNVYCVGQYSYLGEMISEKRDLGKNKTDINSKFYCEEVKGFPSTKLQEIPPCSYSINAFGKEYIKAYADPPNWFNDNSKTKIWKMPPATVCL